MVEGSQRDAGPTRRVHTLRRVRVVVAGVILVVAGVAVAAGIGHGTAPSDPWVAGYESLDAAVVVQDAALLRTDLARAHPNDASLLYDCEIGRRDAARVLSHPSPSNERLRRVVEVTFHEDWQLYAGCVRDLATGSGSDTAVVRAQAQRHLELLRGDESRVNAVARAVAYGPVFSGVR